MFSPSKCKIFAAFCVAVLAIGGCEEERDIPKIENPGVRPIKTMVVNERSRGHTRRFAGVVEAAESTRLSFEVSGTVQKIAVQEGDSVNEGEVIARLDPEPYRLKLENAKARLNEALTRRADTKDTYERRAQLVESGHVSEKSFNAARTAFEQAKAAVEAARSDVAIARRDLRHTKLKAPFAGTIASRNVEPYEDVQAGEPLFVLNSQAAVEVAVSIPESAIAEIERGRSARLQFPTAGIRDVPGRVTEVAGTAAEGGVYPVTVAPSRPTPGVEPGMTAEVLFTFERSESRTFRIPVSAILPHPKGRPRAFVFTYNPEAGKVNKTKVRTRGITGNHIAVAKGLRQGDIVATAGVHHLRDGQRVKLLGQNHAGTD